MWIVLLESTLISNLTRNCKNDLKLLFHSEKRNLQSSDPNLVSQQICVERTCLMSNKDLNPMSVIIQRSDVICLVNFDNSQSGNPSSSSFFSQS